MVHGGGGGHASWQDAVPSALQVQPYGVVPSGQVPSWQNWPTGQVSYPSSKQLVPGGAPESPKGKITPPSIPLQGYDEQYACPFWPQLQTKAVAEGSFVQVSNAQLALYGHVPCPGITHGGGAGQTTWQFVVPSALQKQPYCVLPSGQTPS